MPEPAAQHLLPWVAVPCGAFCDVLGARTTPAALADPALSRGFGLGDHQKYPAKLNLSGFVCYLFLL